MHPRLLPTALALTTALAAAVGLLPGCADDPAIVELRTYERAVEDLVGEDEAVRLRLAGFREDLDAMNAEAMNLLPYAREQAKPFYTRFRDKAAGIEPADPRLARVHDHLLAYLDARVGYVDAVLFFLDEERAKAFQEVARAEVARETARSLVVHEANKDKEAFQSRRDVMEFSRFWEVFQNQYLGPLQRGMIHRGQVETFLNDELRPRAVRIAEQSAPMRDAPGLEGEIARWAVTEVAYHDALLRSLPVQDEILRARRRSDDLWETATAEREKFLEKLKAHRESLR